MAKKERGRKRTQPRRPAPPDPPQQLGSASQVTPNLIRRRRSALISAVFHAHRTPEHDRAPYFFRPMDLDDVVEFVLGETDVAIRNLAQAFLLDYPTPRLGPDHGKPEPPPPLRAALDKLLDGRANDLYKQLAGLPSSVTWPNAQMRPVGTQAAASVSMAPAARLEALRPNLAEPARPPTRFAEAYRLLSQSRCQLSNPSLTITQDPQTLVTTVEAQIDVMRSPGDFTVLADPQNWARQAYLFFELSQRGNLVDGSFVPLPDPKPPGTISYDGPLHELVTMSWNPLFPVDGDNVLNVHYLEGEPGMGVALSVSLSTTIGASSEQGGLDVDGGGFVASPLDNGGTRLTGSKQVRFTERELCGLKLGRWLNLFAPFWLGPWMAMLVFEGACAPRPPA